MALTLRPDSKWWYGEFELFGQRRVIKLGVEVKGVRPTTLRALGDGAFERSRQKAYSAFVEVKRELSDPAKAADRLTRIHKLQTGTTVERHGVDDLERLWCESPRKKPYGKDRAAWAKLIFKRFSEHMQRCHPRIVDIGLITPAIVLGFLSEQAKRGISNRTYNGTRSMLSTAFRGAMKIAGLSVNPVEGVPKKSDDCVPRKPISIQQVDVLMDAARDDSMAGPIVITALCTGMRRANCAFLTWGNVDLDRDQLNVTVRKTGVSVSIPIMPRLRKLLESSPRGGKYCFPDAADAMLNHHQAALYTRLGTLLAKIGIDRNEAVQTSSPRLKRPSQHGFHALKTTFITLALNAGFPIEVLKKIVGNQAVDIVRDRYFQPDHDTIRASMLAKLPREMTGAGAEGVTPVSRVTSLLSSVRSLTSGNFVQLRGAIELELVALQRELEG